MKNTFLKLSAIVLCALSSNASFSSAPASDVSASSLILPEQLHFVSERSGWMLENTTLTAFLNDQEVGVACYADGRMSENAKIESLEVYPQYRKRGIATILLKKVLANIYSLDHSKDIFIDAKPFGDWGPKNNPDFDGKYMARLLTFYEKYGAVRIEEINPYRVMMKFPPRHYVFSVEAENWFMIRAYKNASCAKNDYMGDIEYGFSRTKGGSITYLHVKPHCRRQGVANVLIKKALADIKSKANGLVDISIEAEAFTAKEEHDAEKECQSYMNLDMLISLYKKHGAQLITKKTITADMKISASSK